MWYRDLGVISIGAQSGGPQDGGLGTLKVDLWRALCASCTSSHSAAVNHYALALRISGPFSDFGPEGVDKIRRRKKEGYVGADIVVPESRWSEFSEADARLYLTRVVRDALCACLARLRKDKEQVDENALLSEVDVAMRLFLAKNKGEPIQISEVNK